MAQNKKSVVLVGMRASGKTTCGKLLVKMMEYTVFLDMDHELEKQENCTIQQLINEVGWQGFRQKEAALLVKTIEQHRYNAVIATGGGVIETEECRVLLQTCGLHVLQIIRPIQNIINQLDPPQPQQSETEGGDVDKFEKERRPKYMKPIEETYNNRKQLYFDVSNAIFIYNELVDQEPNFEQIFRNFIQRWTKKHLPLLFEDYSSYLNSNEKRRPPFIPKLLYLPEYQFDNFYVEATHEFGLGFDGIFILFDDLEKYSNNDRSVADRILKILFIIQKIRSFTGLPIVVQISSSMSAIQRRILQHLAKSTVEYILISDVSNSSSDVLEEQTWLENLQVSFPGLRIVYASKTRSKFLNVCNASAVAKQVIEYCNFHLKRYYLFGTPIEASPSPTLHNTGFSLIEMHTMEFVEPPTFQICLIDTKLHMQINDPVSDIISDEELEHYFGFLKTKDTRRYYLCQTSDERVIKYTINQTSFHGASVTIPLKEKVSQFMDELSASASKVEAVNTIMRTINTSGYAKFFGDNTDWIGICGLAANSLRQTNNLKGLVVGAGGTSRAACYSLTHGLGMEAFVYNRTIEKARSMCEDLGCTLVEDLTAFGNEQVVRLVVSTVPAASNFTLPESIIRQKPVIIDAAYKPRETSLVLQGFEYGCTVFVGIQMLVGQGLKQFQLWTGIGDEELKEKRKQIELAVYAFYER